MRTSDRDYTNLIKKMVLDYVDFDICKLVVKKIDDTKNSAYDQALGNGCLVQKQTYHRYSRGIGD